MAETSASSSPNITPSGIPLQSFYVSVLTQPYLAFMHWFVTSHPGILCPYTFLSPRQLLEAVLTSEKLEKITSGWSKDTVIKRSMNAWLIFSLAMRRALAGRGFTVHEESTILSARWEVLKNIPEHHRELAHWYRLYHALTELHAEIFPDYTYVPNSRKQLKNAAKQTAIEKKKATKEKQKIIQEKQDAKLSGTATTRSKKIGGKKKESKKKKNTQDIAAGGFEEADADSSNASTPDSYGPLTPVYHSQSSLADTEHDLALIDNQLRFDGYPRDIDTNTSYQSNLSHPDISNTPVDHSGLTQSVLHIHLSPGINGTPVYNDAAAFEDTVTSSSTEQIQQIHFARSSSEDSTDAGPSGSNAINGHDQYTTYLPMKGQPTLSVYDQTTHAGQYYGLPSSFDNFLISDSQADGNAAQDFDLTWTLDDDSDVQYGFGDISEYVDFGLGPAVPTNATYSQTYGLRAADYTMAHANFALDGSSHQEFAGFF
ncbi:hypothetical protein H0H87_005305 [Tephrocybe sp. NHM501043]|nr:hypothetical protein H0H87_005305 [Tephrocybe sp. NHM501043]